MFELLTSTRLTWNAFLDIFIVAFLIYQILVFIKGTRAVQMVVGLGLIVAFYYFARWAQLETVT
jgi:diadenylate cyclase